MASPERQMVGPYEILEHLGQGGMATVYKGYHPRLDRVVAIKMIHQSFLDDAGFVNRFEREAQIVAKLEHPNIVPVYDYAEYNGIPYIVMKFIEGSTLKHVLDAGPLLMDDLLHVMRPIAAALDYAHQKGVLHRDIKPSNLMLDMSATPYLADFGLARTVHGGASTLSLDMMIGTPYYMSPEQARGDTNLDKRTDIYSLGIVLYELLTGQVPFAGTTAYAIMHQHITAALPPARSLNPDIPPGLEAALSRALAKNRDERFESAGALIQAVDSSLRRRSASGTLPNARPLESSVIAAHSQQMKIVPAPVVLPAPLSQQDRVVQPAIPAPMPVAVRKAAPPAKRAGVPGVLWVAGGLTALAIILLLGLAALNRVRQPSPVVLPTMAVLDATAAASSAARPTLPATWTPAPSAPNSPSASEPSGSDTAFTPSEPVALINVPVMNVNDAQVIVDNNPSYERAYLTLYRAQVEARQVDAAAVTLETGARYTHNLALYLLTAAAEANQLGDAHTAVSVLRGGLARMQGDPTYPTFRAAAGEALYQAALSADNVSIFDLGQLPEPPEGAPIRAARNIQADSTPIFSAMVARALIERDRLRAAQPGLMAVLEAEPNLPEGLLVSGELLMAEGDAERARAQWEAVLNTADAPTWVQARARALLGR